MARATTRRRRGDAVREGEPQRRPKSSQGLLIAGIAAGVLAGLAVTLVLLSGGGEPEKPPTGRPDPADVVTTDVVTTDVATADVATADAKPPRVVSRQDASRRLTAIRAMRGASFERYEEMRKALVSFAEEFPGVPETDEGAALLRKIDDEYAQMAEIALAVATDDAKYLAGQGRYGDAETSLRGVAERHGADPWLREKGTPAIERALADIKKSTEAVVSGTLANAGERLRAGDVRGARAALSLAASWLAQDRARAKELLDEIAGRSEAGDGYASGLLGEYFAGHDRDPDKRKLQRVDPNVFFDWGGGRPSPEVPKDNFSARWTGDIMAPADGHYVFSIQYDDGAILAIDGKTIAETWGQRAGTLVGEVDLRAGWRGVRLDFKEGSGHARIKLEWQGPGFTKCPVPGAVLRTKAP